MIVDTSAIIAILWGEAEADQFAHVIAAAPRVGMSVANALEASIVVDARRDPLLSNRLDDLIHGTPIRLDPVTAQQWVRARAAYRNFGRGSGHAAKLNFGDCFAYALARDRGEPLLFKDDDFIHTDITPAA